METKSAEEIVSIIEKKIMFLMLEHLPDPTCPRKRQQNEWKKDKVKKLLSQRLYDTTGTESTVV